MIARDITRDCEFLLALAIALVALGCAAIARADSRGAPDPARPSWPEVEPCQADALVRRRVEQHDPAAWTLISVQTKLERAAHGYRLTLETERNGVQGVRVFEAAQCSELVDAATLLLTLMLDEARDEAPPAPPPAPAPAPPPPAVAPTSRRARATLQAAAMGELGYLPRAGLGGELAMGVAAGRSRFELAGLWLPSVRSERGADGARVAIGLWAARVGYCHRLVGRSLALFGCLGLELGRAHGEGLDLEPERERSYLWIAGRAGLRASVALGRGVALLLEPALAVPFARRRFVSTDASGAPREVLHTPAPVSGRVAIALEAAF